MLMILPPWRHSHTTTSLTEADFQVLEDIAQLYAAARFKTVCHILNDAKACLLAGNKVAAAALLSEARRIQNNSMGKK